MIFTNLVSDHFGDSFMLIVRPLIKVHKYNEALESIINKVFNKSKRQKSFLKSIIDLATYYTDVNLHQFINALNIVYEMLNQCNINKTDEDKLSDISDIIERGNHKKLKEVLKFSHNSRYDYKTTLELLLETYEDNQFKTMKNTKKTNQHVKRATIHTINQKTKICAMD